MRTCIFCGRKADSKEHLWPGWILKGLKIKEKLRHSIAGRDEIILSPGLSIKCVCKECNQGWMSDLESASIPVVGSLARDISLWLDTSQRSLISLWAIKTAMVIEQVNTRNRAACYGRQERECLRISSSFPPHTTIWLGRYCRSSIGAFGTDISINLPGATKAADGCVTTIVVGRLAIQVMTIHVRAEHSRRTITINPKEGPWDRLLIEAWPGRCLVQWPPPLTFTNEGRLSIATLMDRWRIGTSR